MHVWKKSRDGLGRHLEFGVQRGVNTKTAVARLKIKILEKFKNRCARLGWGYKLVHTKVLRHVALSRGLRKSRERLRKTRANFESPQNA